MLLATQAGRGRGRGNAHQNNGPNAPRTPNVRNVPIWNLKSLKGTYPWAWYVPTREEIEFIESCPRGKASEQVADWLDQAERSVNDKATSRRQRANIYIGHARRQALALSEASDLQEIEKAFASCEKVRAIPMLSRQALNLFDFVLYYAGKSKPEIVFDKLASPNKHARTFTAAIAAIVASDGKSTNDLWEKVANRSSWDDRVAVVRDMWKQDAGVTFDTRILPTLEDHELVRMGAIAKVREHYADFVASLPKYSGESIEANTKTLIPVLHLLGRSNKPRAMDLINFYVNTTKSSLSLDVIDALFTGLDRRKSDSTRSIAFLKSRIVERLEAEWGPEEEAAHAELPSNGRRRHQSRDIHALNFAHRMEAIYISTARSIADYNPTSEFGRLSKLDVIQSFDECASTSKFLSVLAKARKQSPSTLPEHDNFHEIPNRVLVVLLRVYTRARHSLHYRPEMLDRLRQIVDVILTHPGLRLEYREFVATIQLLCDFHGNRIPILHRLESWSQLNPKASQTNPLQIKALFLHLVQNTSNQEAKRSARFSLHGLDNGDTSGGSLECDAAYEVGLKWYRALKADVEAARENGEFPPRRARYNGAFKPFDEAAWHEARINMLRTLLNVGRWKEAEAFIESDFDGVRDKEIFNAILHFHALYTGNRELAIELLAEMQSNGVEIGGDTLTCFAHVFLGVSDDVYIGEGFTGLGAPEQIVKECIGHILAMCRNLDIVLSRALIQRLLWNAQRCGLEYEHQQVLKHAARHNVKHSGVPFHRSTTSARDSDGGDDDEEEEDYDEGPSNKRSA
ncbi:Hypothetical Protein FCC1311_052482 [Hondaea fermentalgiana]|uniref:Uncharacterized protein n=1 Tax=Hondaea fermentalgiana TaxID=2315210 RepID=A0A2R5GDJ9_9STRA|nr:Hypothetical Protein FCC1311_052482 [Hondaea fermentalgiana]|eukprot:GBG29026.1 Hypothetical Protein FCC1311_052482 [Hondaea fermentalgiana]